jgi:hypothetical protein
MLFQLAEGLMLVAVWESSVPNCGIWVMLPTICSETLSFSVVFRVAD